jgi:hypothetical protein
MPVYVMGCSCGHTEEIYRSISRMNEDLPEHCGVVMQRKIVAPMVAADIQPYRSMITGEMIHSRSQHRAHLSAHGCVEVGNEKMPEPKPLAPPPGLKETLIDVVNQKLK